MSGGEQSTTGRNGTYNANEATARARKPPPRSAEVDQSSWPDWLTAVWAKLDANTHARFSGPWTAPDLDHRMQTLLCVKALRLHGLTLPQMIEAAGLFPAGFGKLVTYRNLITGLWADEEAQEEVERAKQGRHRAQVRDLAARIYDPWEDPKPKPWPDGILARAFEETIAEIALRDSVDMGAQAMAYLAAASGAAPKDALFTPYAHGGWTVRPNIWVMVVAESGMRKTPLLSNAFPALKRINAERYRAHEHDLKRYLSLTGEARAQAQRPEEPHSLIVDDITVEGLQEVLRSNPRGTLMLKEEVVGMFDFGRYRKGSDGVASRGFLLNTHDGGSTYVHRKSGGGVLIPNAAMTVFGCTQPARLGQFKNLDEDGLLQRFLIVLATRGAGSREGLVVKGQDKLDQMIERLVTFGAFSYRTTPEGGKLIRQTEATGRQWEEASDYGLGFPAFVRKLHGTHARLALVLHLMETPEDEVIPDAVIERAGRLVLQYLLPHALAFYSVLPDGGLALTRNIAGWLLTKAPDRFTTAHLIRGVRPCRGMILKQIQEALDPLRTGGWIEPESAFPDNHAWTLTAGLREAFADRTAAETERRATLRALMQAAAC
jgi:hypothetical protein